MNDRWENGVTSAQGPVPVARWCNVAMAYDGGTARAATLAERPALGRFTGMDRSRDHGAGNRRGTDLPRPMLKEEAIARVRRHVAATGGDLRPEPSADRFGVGWTVFVPLRPARVAVFYVGDDGVVEAASSAVGPVGFVEDFERRFRIRHSRVR